MQTDPILSYHNIDASPAVESLIHRRIAMLQRRDDRITGCEVMMEAPQKKQRHGRVFRVRLNLRMPGPDLTISRKSAQGSAQDDLMMAVNRAFSAAEKALKRRKKVRGGVEVKHHPPVLHGAIVDLGSSWAMAGSGPMPGAGSTSSATASPPTAGIAWASAPACGSARSRARRAPSPWR